MANTYVSDPRKIATPGDVVRVKVLEVDPKRRRISLTMRLDDAPGDRATATRPAIAPSGSEKRLRPAERPGGSNRVPANSGGMAEAFRRAGLRGKASSSGLPVHLQLLPTPPHGDAVTFDYGAHDRLRHGLAPC